MVIPFLLFDWTEEEKLEIEEAIAGTEAAKRLIVECSSADRPDRGCGANHVKSGRRRRVIVLFQIDDENQQQIEF